MCYNQFQALNLTNGESELSLKNVKNVNLATSFILASMQDTYTLSA